MPPKSNKEEFVKKAICIHDNEYGYDNFIYVNSKIKGLITCYKHGDFLQTPANHIRKNGLNQGCRECGFEKTIKANTSNAEKFINKSNVVHKNEYTYLKFVYIDRLTDGIITCKIHGDFKQKPRDHLKGSGCHECGGSKKSNINKFIKNSQIIHKNYYTYLNFIYLNNKTHGFITCHEHGDFPQVPADHLSGYGCPDCGGSKKSSIEKFILCSNIIHHNKYDYSKFIYINNKTNGIIICPEHGEFSQKPENHLRGQGCIYCKNKNEGIIKNFLIKKYFSFETQYKMPIIKNKQNIKVDYFLPYHNMIIEYNGSQHYEPALHFSNGNLNKAILNLKEDKKRDGKLRNYCKQNNINLLEIDGRKYVGKKLIKFLEKYFDEMEILCP